MKKYFKYENKNAKNIRLKDLLIIFSIFILCVITVVVSGTAVNKKIKTNTNLTQDNYLDTDDIEPIIVNETEKNETKQNLNKENIVYNKTTYEFVKPVDGGISKPFSPQSLIFSETMDDWRTHNGIDILCPLDTKIVSAESGIVKAVYSDINYGYTVVIQTGEYQHIYSSLSSDINLTEGQNINKGEVIGTTSDTCMSEICDEPHLHFEMKNNDVYVNPLDIISFN